MLKQDSVQINNELLGLNKTFVIVHNLEQCHTNFKIKFEEWFYSRGSVDEITEENFCMWLMKSSNGLYTAMTREIYDLIHKH